jgi:Zn finger protein HypA/HybF involved in hydrogenase expression
MFNEISAAVSSAKVALDIAKAAHGLSNYNELVAAVSEVNSKLVDATVVTLASLEKQAALTNRINELEIRLKEVESWENQINRYKLHSFASSALAHKLEESMQNGEPMHYLCTTCINQRKKTILQPRDVRLYCPVCDKSIVTREEPPIDYSPSEGSWMS